ncbi:MAG: hypothetical protein QOI57_3029 [Rubrobacteraceae bacterium]|nr:hypothetical protein [Rubrobacteraceae bacterium]
MPNEFALYFDRLVYANLPTGRIEGDRARSFKLAQLAPQTAFAELQQNRELLGTLEELRARQEELTQLNSELEDTNRGVVALYAELDEKAGQLQQANELKTRFLSKVSQNLAKLHLQRLQVHGTRTGARLGDSGFCPAGRRIHRCRRWDRYRLR